MKVKKKLAKNLMVSAFLALENAQDMLFDASVLFDANRFPRAKAIFILCAEECTKTKILMECALGKRKWSIHLKKRLENHVSKLMVATAVLAKGHFKMKHYPRLDEFKKFRNFKALQTYTSKLNELGEELEKKNSNKERPSKDINAQKMSALYTRIWDNGRTGGVPDGTKEDTALAFFLALHNLTESKSSISKNIDQVKELFGSMEGFEKAINRVAAKEESSLSRFMFFQSKELVESMLPAIEKFSQETWPETEPSQNDSQ